MFIFTAKVNRRKLTAAAVAGVVLCGALVAVFVLLGGQGDGGLRTGGPQRRQNQ